MEEHESSTDILKMDQPRLQQIVDYIIEKISNGEPDFDHTKIKCEYLSGQFAYLPKSFLVMQGHKLEELIKSKLDGLKRYHKADELKTTILKRVIDEHPTLIPTCIVDAFKELQMPT